jgi:hypothetical protein
MSPDGAERRTKWAIVVLVRRISFSFVGRVWNDGVECGFVLCLVDL